MSRAVSKIFSLVIELIFRAIFIGEDAWFKHSPLIINVVVSILLLMMCSGEAASCVYSFSLVMAIHILISSLRLFMYSIVLALLPSLWYFITTLPFTLSVSQSLMITFRVFTSSIIILTLVFTWNPMELSYILYRLARTRYSIFPSLLWKVIPHILRDINNALLSNELKGESLWKGIAVSFVASIEYSTLYEEGLHSKVGSFRPTYSYDVRIVTLYLGIAVISLNYLLYVSLLNI